MTSGRSTRRERERNLPAGAGAVEIKQAITQGPLPGPETLAAYKAIDGELLERIVAAADEERRHRHEMDRQNMANQAEFIRLDHKRSVGGIWAACYGLTLAVVVSLVAAAMNWQPFAYIFGGGALATIIVAFLTATRNKPSDKGGTTA